VAKSWASMISAEPGVLKRWKVGADPTTPSRPGPAYGVECPSPWLGFDWPHPHVCGCEIVNVLGG
jgi:hypothetical protein